ncbi:MAG TPA: hypothetical protein DCQ34_11320 [Chitinophagaceae bacterium]|nr:hypothetical protein [Chitinophagaceae bacterium]
MRYFNLLALVLMTGIIFSACQKELYFDSTEGQSIGTLQADSSFDCLPSSVSGVYQADSLLGSGNYLDVTVNVSQAGSYTIKSDTINGFSFSGSGVFGTTGINTVRLYGTGRPILEGINTFIIKYGTSFCNIDVEVTPPNQVPAVYSFAGAGGFCTGATLNGTYMEALATNSSNTVLVGVNVSVAGTYDINTTTVNGISFSGSGVFSSTGAQQVLLTATGTPAATGTFNFPISGSGSSCSFSVTFDPAAPPAVFTMEGAPGNCTAVVLSGSYVVGVPMSANNTASLNAVVTTPGSYSITGTTVNGVTFSGSGLFSITGTQTITLTASGTPAATGTFSFPVTGNSSTCPFNVTFTNPPADFINCRIDGVYSTFDIDAIATRTTIAGVEVLSIEGRSGIASFPSLSLNLSKATGGSVGTGTYTVNQLTLGNLISCDYNAANGTNYFAGTDPLNQSQNPAFTIVINSITPTRVAGTFAGPVKDNNGAGPAVRVITQGTFDVPLQ